MCVTRYYFTGNLPCLKRINLHWLHVCRSQLANWVTYHYYVNPDVDQWKPQNFFAADMEMKRIGSGIPPCQPAVAYRNFDMTLLDNSYVQIFTLQHLRNQHLAVFNTAKIAINVCDTL